MPRRRPPGRPSPGRGGDRRRAADRQRRTATARIIRSLLDHVTHRLKKRYLSDSHLHDLLPHRAAALVARDGEHAALARLHHRRQLRLLRLVGLALRLPARRLHALEPRSSRSRSTARRRARAGRRCSWSRSPATSRCSATSSTTTSSSARRTTWPTRSGWGCRSSTRSIVLPVGISFFTFMAISYVVDTYRGDFEPVTLGRLRRLPLVLPAPRRRADRARRRAAPADGDAAATRAGSTRAAPST